MCRYCTASQNCQNSVSLGTLVWRLPQHLTSRLTFAMLWSRESATRYRVWTPRAHSQICQLPPPTVWIPWCISLINLFVICIIIYVFSTKQTQWRHGLRFYVPSWRMWPRFQCLGLETAVPRGIPTPHFRLWSCLGSTGLGSLGSAPLFWCRCGKLCAHHWMSLLQNAANWRLKKLYFSQRSARA